MAVWRFKGRLKGKKKEGCYLMVIYCTEVRQPLKSEALISANEPKSVMQDESNRVLKVKTKNHRHFTNKNGQN